MSSVMQLGSVVKMLLQPTFTRGNIKPGPRSSKLSLAQAFTPEERNETKIFSPVYGAYKLQGEKRMSHVFHQLYYHFTWVTYSREPLIDRAWRPHLLDILNEEVKTRGGWPIRHNAMPDHTHLLCRLPPTIV